jgi:hypothetical protein
LLGLEDELNRIGMGRRRDPFAALRLSAEGENYQQGDENRENCSEFHGSPPSYIGTEMCHVMDSNA